MERFNWARLNHLQLGRYAEYLVKMEFTLWGFSVFTSEVDDRGIDFVVRTNDSRHYDVQVKSIRGLNYIFFPKHSFPIAIPPNEKYASGRESDLRASTAGRLSSRQPHSSKMGSTISERGIARSSNTVFVPAAKIQYVSCFIV